MKTLPITALIWTTLANAPIINPPVEQAAFGSNAVELPTQRSA
jgi:hypothetical protein